MDRHEVEEAQALSCESDKSYLMYVYASQVSGKVCKARMPVGDGMLWDGPGSRSKWTLATLSRDFPSVYLAAGRNFFREFECRILHAVQMN